MTTPIERGAEAVGHERWYRTNRVPVATDEGLTRAVFESIDEDALSVFLAVRIGLGVSGPAELATAIKAHLLDGGNRG